MISYAQNHEDVLLARTLADTDSGFYVDVGAYDPTIDSVTRHFYDHGWHGINIEPQSSYASRLREARPRDVTLELALSDHTGSANLYEHAVGDGVATIDPTQARRLDEDSDVVGEHSVPVTTLAEVCAQHCDEGTTISFLKVDVEGHERPVLAGADWARWQPRVVLVEATEPRSTRPSHEPWEPILLEAGYIFAQFDGLNRYYARRDEHRLIELLSVPVNVLDFYEPYLWTSRVERLEAEVASLMDRADAGSDTARYRALIRSFESLRERYYRLNDALHEEHTQRVMERERIARLAQAVRLLSQNGNE